MRFKTTIFLVIPYLLLSYPSLAKAEEVISLAQAYSMALEVAS